jgi:1,4-alpha-glucan branching enzyme
VTAGRKRVTAGDAQPRQAGERAEEQPGRPAGPAATDGTVDVRFTLPAEVHAGTVALCGEFNNWSDQDIRLERGRDGSWQGTAALEPGRSYRYRYLLDGKRWENAWQADRYVPNPYGSTDSVVVVG